MRERVVSRWPVGGYVGFLFGWLKSFGTRYWWWLHNIVNILNAPELYTLNRLKWWILCFSYFTTINKMEWLLMVQKLYQWGLFWPRWASEQKVDAKFAFLAKKDEGDSQITMEALLSTVFIQTGTALKYKCIFIRDEMFPNC